MPISFSAYPYTRSTFITKENIFFVLFLLVGLYFRTSGLFRGLGIQGGIYHPDEPKQILALFNFLNGDYIRYYGSLFYDGYPYGLNHLDEYLLRPFLFLFSSDPVDQHSLYYYGRLLRLFYSMIIMIITYQLVFKLVNSRPIALLALLLTALSPLSITVSHFATGDIGVDLFSALCFLFLLFSFRKSHTLFWLFCCGVMVGAAFSAKYNGLLVGMVPGFFLLFELFQKRELKPFVKKCTLLGIGVLLGIVLFTPAFLLEPKPTLGNMLANFTFIKNYNVPAEILAKSWIERACMGISNNTVYIVSSLGIIVFLSSLLMIVIHGKQFFSYSSLPSKQSSLENKYILALALFPLFSLFIAMSGKYVVQPFHFSYLQTPLIILSCILLAKLSVAQGTVSQGTALLLAVAIIFEFGRVSLKENFFWRLEDNVFHAQNLPASIYDREAFYTHRSDTIRSLYLEPSGNSVFKNHRIAAKGPDAQLWNSIEVAPLPQVPNPIGKNWIFLNGPSFPRNERMVVIHGENHGQTLKRFIVVPAGHEIAGLGIRSGSFATEAQIKLGSERIEVQMEPHQQKLISNSRDTESGPPSQISEKIEIIPLEVYVPHNDLWVTILGSQKEKQLFTLFGGGQEGKATSPEPVPAEIMKDYHDALTRIRYLESILSWRVVKGKRIPMWEVALAAGHYKLICEVDGLADTSEIAIVFEDAKGDLHGGKQQSFQVKKGIQRLEYTFTKAFVPYQTRFVISGKKGSCQILSFRLTPDYPRIEKDFEKWRKNGKQPGWISRFNTEKQ